MDNDKNNNSIDNLNIVSNVLNTKDKTNLVGVRRHKGRYQARITTPEGIRISIGWYDTADEAHNSYMKKFIEYGYDKKND